MRFKAELASEQLHLLYSLIGPISKISSQAVIYLDPEYLRLSSRDADGISCFAELKTHGGIFLSHRIESVADNAIVFEIDLLQWKSAIQSVIGERHDGPYSCQTNSASDGHPSGGGGSGSNDTHSMSLHTTTMKLAKRHGGIPCLCLDGKCHGSAAFEVYHAIPVRIMRTGDIQYHLPPQIQLPDVQLELTNEKPLRVVVDRLKSISPVVYLEGSMAGELTLCVDGDGASIRTFFSKLLPRWEDTKSGSASNLSDTTPATCILKVDTKKLSAALLWQAHMVKTVSSALLCMVEQEMLVIHVLLNPPSVGFFTYYVPVHYMSPTELNPHGEK